MPNTPVDAHTEELEQLAGLYALRVLEGDELARFEGHFAECERCRLMVRLDLETLGRVALVAPPMDPSPGFKARLMQRAAEELAAAGASTAPATPPPVPARDARPGLEAGPDPTGAPRAEPIQLRPRPTNLVSFWRRSPWMSALAAVFVVGLVAWGAFTYQNQPVATYELAGNAPGSARVVVRRSGAAELDMDGVPNPEPGSVYEVWIIPAGKQPVAAGISATGNAKVPLAGDVRGSTVAITKERGLVDKPTSEPIMLTVVQS